MTHHDRVQKVLNALGHPEALVTRRSIIADFIPFDLRESEGIPLGEFIKRYPKTHLKNRKTKDITVLKGLTKDGEEFVTSVSEKLGFEITASDYIMDVAKRL